MLNARRNETISQLKDRAMNELDSGTHLHLHLDRTIDAAPLQTRQRPHETKKSNFMVRGAGDAQNAVSVGTLPAPEPNSHYELQDNEDGSIDVVLISDVSEATPPDPNQTDPNQTGDSYSHRLHTSNDPQLRKMNAANRDFWKRTRK